ncbi:sensor histidine kinase [Sinomicrobium sp. M5D2P17]
MKSKTIHIFFARLLLIYGLHLIIKWGDETFHHFFDFTRRGIYFSVFVISLWMLCLYLLDYIKNKWFTPRKKPFPYLFFCIVYGYVFALITNVVYRYTDIHHFGTDWGDIGYFNPVLIFGILILFISALSFYEYFQTELAVKENQLLTEKLKKENAITHYKLLKAQIEPHFLFNSLSVLSSLVHKDADLASDFILKLSRMLRFSIDRNDRMYVFIDEEINFMKDYFFLIQTRFGNSVSLKDDLRLTGRQDIILPPGTLQTLMENAIKHNGYSPEKPLEVRIYNDEKSIYISNNTIPKEHSYESTGIGLTNLSKRFHLLCRQDIGFGMVEENFIVRLPIIFKNTDHAHIDY